MLSFMSRDKVKACQECCQCVTAFPLVLVHTTLKIVTIFLRHSPTPSHNIPAHELHTHCVINSTQLSVLLLRTAPIVLDRKNKSMCSDLLQKAQWRRGSWKEQKWNSGLMLSLFNKVHYKSSCVIDIDLSLVFENFMKTQSRISKFWTHFYFKRQE